nr:hypothetical protein [uncultured Marinifilum sp.]
MINDLKKEEKLLNEPAFRDLSDLFSSPIKSQDKDKYDKAILSLFRAIAIYGISINEAAEAEDFDTLSQKIASIYNFHGFEANPQDILKNYKDLGDELTIMSPSQKTALSFHLIAYALDNLYNKIPKRGFFCSRKSIFKEWTTSFIQNVTEQSEKYEMDFIRVLVQNIVSYLTTHHNDKFYVMTNESIHDANKRIFETLTSTKS